MQSKEFDRLMVEPEDLLTDRPVKATSSKALGRNSRVSHKEVDELTGEDKEYLKSNEVDMPKDTMLRIRRYAERLRMQGCKENLVRARTIKRFGIRVYDIDQ